MEEKENVMTAGAVQGAEARKENGTAAPFGKFRDADALLQAYNSLEAEFTRRSQRLRELEGKFAAEQAQKAAPAPAAETDGQDAMYARIEEAAARAVEAYLAARAQEQAPRVLAGGGAFALAPARRVRTFGEAGELARELFNKNGNQ